MPFSACLSATENLMTVDNSIMEQIEAESMLDFTFMDCIGREQNRWGGSSSTNRIM